MHHVDRHGKRWKGSGPYRILGKRYISVVTRKRVAARPLARRHVFLRSDVAAADRAAHASAAFGAAILALLEVTFAVDDARHGAGAATHRATGTPVDDRRAARVGIGARD